MPFLTNEQSGVPPNEQSGVLPNEQSRVPTSGGRRVFGICDGEVRGSVEGSIFIQGNLIDPALQSPILSISITAIYDGSWEP